MCFKKLSDDSHLVAYLLKVFQKVVLITLFKSPLQFYGVNIFFTNKFNLLGLVFAICEE